MRLGRLIKRYRLERDMSLRDLGTAASLDFSYIAKLERGLVKQPSRESIRRIAQALDAPVSEFEMAAGYLPEDNRTLAASRSDGYDTPLPPDVQRAVELILEELRQKNRDKKT